MRMLKSLSTSVLLAANVALLTFILSPQSAQASGGGDFCNEQSPIPGCGCITGSAWLPDGCHESGAFQFDCLDESDC